MSLDANLFTLIITASKDGPQALDLVDPSGVVHYRKRRATTPAAYSFSIFDPTSDSLLATVSAPNPTSKQKTIELFNPSVVVPISFSGTISFKWSFNWEEHSFEWKKEACYLIRKPDPPVIVCTCDPPHKTKRSALQVLDYNLQRFDFDDRKGLEIVIIAGLLSFYDQADDIHRRPDAGVIPVKSPGLPTAGPATEEGKAKKPVEIPTDPSEKNEVNVLDEGAVDEYVHHCVDLLKDESLVYIVLRARSASTVPKCVQIAEATKRIMYKTGTDDDEELHQYVSYEEDKSAEAKGKSKGRARINLDEPFKPDSRAGNPEYRPPESLTIHLSKIPMPELQPKPAARPPPIATPKPRAASHSPPRSAPATTSPSPQPEKLRKQDKGKGREDPLPPRSAVVGPSPGASPPVDKGKGRATTPEPRPSRLNAPQPESRPDKGKGRENPIARPVSMHITPPTVPKLRIDPGPGPAPNIPSRPQSYQPPQQPMGQPRPQALSQQPMGQPRPPQQPSQPRPPQPPSQPRPPQQPSQPRPTQQPSGQPRPPASPPALLYPAYIPQGPQVPYRPYTAPPQQPSYLAPSAPAGPYPPGGPMYNGGPPVQQQPNGPYEPQRVPSVGQNLASMGLNVFDKLFKTHPQT